MEPQVQPATRTAWPQARARICPLQMLWSNEPRQQTAQTRTRSTAGSGAQSAPGGAGASLSMYTPGAHCGWCHSEPRSRAIIASKPSPSTRQRVMTSCLCSALHSGHLAGRASLGWQPSEDYSTFTGHRISACLPRVVPIPCTPRSRRGHRQWVAGVRQAVYTWDRACHCNARMMSQRYRRLQWKDVGTSVQRS